MLCSLRIGNDWAECWERLAELDNEGENLPLGALYFGWLDPIILDFLPYSEKCRSWEWGLLHQISMGVSKNLLFNKSKTKPFNEEINEQRFCVLFKSVFNSALFACTGQF